MSQRIVIEIVDKVATCLTKKPLVCGNSNYIVDFVFDEEWDKHDIKTAVFKVNGGCINKVFRGNECTIPVMQNTLVVTVGVFAGTIDDGTLSTSTPALVRCKPCATDGDCAPPPPQDDVYNQIIELCEEAVSTAKSVEEKLNSGDFSGKSPYDIAVEGGFEGTEEEYNEILMKIPKISDDVSELYTENVITGDDFEELGYAWYYSPTIYAKDGAATLFLPMGWTARVKSVDDIHDNIEASEGDITYGIDFGESEYVYLEIYGVNNERISDVTITQTKGKVADIEEQMGDIENQLGDIDKAFDELHAYAQALISGGVAE